MSYTFYLYSNPRQRATVESYQYAGKTTVQVRTNNVLTVKPYPTIEGAFEALYLLGYKQVR